MSAHTEDKSNHCLICGGDFKQESALTVHSRCKQVIFFYRLIYLLIHSVILPLVKGVEKFENGGTERGVVEEFHP